MAFKINNRTINRLNFNSNEVKILKVDGITCWVKSYNLTINEDISEYGIGTTTTVTRTSSSDPEASTHTPEVLHNGDIIFEGDVLTFSVAAHSNWENASVIATMGGSTVVSPVTVTNDLLLVASADVIENFITYSSANSFIMKGASGMTTAGYKYKECATDLNHWQTVQTNELYYSADKSGTHKLYVRGSYDNSATVVSLSSGDNFILESGTNISCSGNLLNLSNYEGVQDQTITTIQINKVFENMKTELIAGPKIEYTGSNSCNINFKECYMGCTKMVSVGNVVFTTQPILNKSDTSLQGAFTRMFMNCTSLINAPAFPECTYPSQSINDVYYCAYYQMFLGCSALVDASSVIITGMQNLYPVVLNGDYWAAEAFKNCTSLTGAPVLKGTGTRDYCYQAMFMNCSSLQTPPKLPAATSLSNRCYYQMFKDSGLTKIPRIVARSGTTTAYHSSIQEMLWGTQTGILTTSSTGANRYPLPNPKTGESYPFIDFQYESQYLYNYTYYTSSEIIPQNDE